MIPNFKFIENGHSHSQSNNVGTLTYMAPEIIRGEQYGKEVDVYSFGILMFEIATDSIPFPDLEKKKISPYVFQRKVSEESYRPIFNVPINENLKKLIEKCWADEPSKRPTFDDIFDQLLGKTAENYFLDNVDGDEFKIYVEDIVEIFDPSEILVDKVSKYKKEIIDLKSQEENMKNEIKNLKSKINDLRKQEEKIETENHSLKDKEMKMKNEIMDIKSQEENMKIKIKILKLLKKDHESLKKDYVKLKEDHESLKKDYVKLTEDHESLKKDYVKLKKDHESLKKDYVKLTEDHESLKKDYEKLEKQSLEKK